MSQMSKKSTALTGAAAPPRPPGTGPDELKARMEAARERIAARERGEGVRRARAAVVAALTARPVGTSLEDLFDALPAAHRPFLAAAMRELALDGVIGLWRRDDLDKAKKAILGLLSLTFGGVSEHRLSVHLSKQGLEAELSQAITELYDEGRIEPSPSHKHEDAKYAMVRGKRGAR